MSKVIRLKRKKISPEMIIFCHFQVCHMSLAPSISRHNNSTLPPFSINLTPSGMNQAKIKRSVEIDIMLFPLSFPLLLENRHACGGSDDNEDAREGTRGK